MKQKLLNKFWLRVGIIVAVMTTALAGTVMAETVTYEVTSTSAVSSSGTVPTGSSATYSSTYNTKFQLTANNSATLTLSGYEGCRITNITLHMKSNSSSGAGTLAYSTDGGSNYTYIIGSSSEGVNFNNGWHNSWSTSYVDVSKDVDITATSSALKIVIAATVNSLYCDSYTITYTPEGSTSESGKVTLTSTNLELTGSYTTDTEKTIDGITYVYTDLMLSNQNIQAKASSGTIKNTTPYPGDITSVAITHSGTARATTINGSTDGENWTQVATGSGSINADFSGRGYKYFQITRGSNAAYWTKIEITYSIVSYTIDAATNNESWGTVSLSGNVITATPAEGYRIASPAYSVNPANSATVVQNGNVFTVTPSDNTTVTINFEAIPTHTATFSVNGTTSTQTVAEDAAITFPDNPADIDGKTFMGWVNTPITGTTNTAPEFVTTASMGTEDVTYYAVFADVNTNVQEFTKTYGFETSSDDDWTIDSSIARAQAYKKSGSYSGKITTNNTYVTFKNKVNVTSFSFEFMRKTTNNNYNVYIETSSDNSNWTAVESYAMSSFSEALTWYNKSHTFDGQTPLYVRFHCYNTTAERYVDDITITYTASTTTYSGYCTTVAPPASITLGSYAIEVDAAEHEGTLTLAYENLEITEMNDFGVQFYDADNNELNEEPGWIEVSIAEQDPAVGEGYVVSYYMIDNDGAERTAYFKVFAMGYDDFVYSDLVTVTQSATFAVTLNASGYATFASTSPLDFTNTESNGYSAWQVTGVDASGVITCVQITGAVAAGTGVLLKGTAGAPIQIVKATTGTDISSTNKLVGFTAATEINSNEYFGLKGAKFVKVNGGTVPAGKALLPASVVYGTSPVNAFTFNFDEDATAIKAIDNGQLTTDGVIYNVAGQRLGKMQKGINIVNGKKILK